MTRQRYSRTARPAPAARRRRQGGFLLPMMAGLLVVAGSTAAVVVMKEQRESFWVPRTETTSDLSEVNAALIAYQRSKNHRLPCPASLSSGSGVEECAASPPAGTTDVGDVGTGSKVRIGALPTRTLGLPDSAGEDKWGNKLTYAVVKTHTDAFQFSNSVAVGAGINVTTATLGSTINDQAYIIISHGKDGKGATPAKATSVGIACTSTSGQDQENCDNDDQSFSALGMNTDPGANYFDDIVIFGTPDPVAQQTNRPCTSSTQTWLTSCSASVPAINHGNFNLISNTASGYSGSVEITCNDGVLSQQNAICNGGSCTFIGQLTAGGQCVTTGPGALIVANSDVTLSAGLDWFARAVAACDNLTSNGYSDWRLPEYNELSTIYVNLASLTVMPPLDGPSHIGFYISTTFCLPGFARVVYWQSVWGPWCLSGCGCMDSFNTGPYTSLTAPYPVRCVRNSN